MTNNAKIPDLQTLIMAGIDPKTGLPIKFANSEVTKPQLKSNIQRAIRIIDEQNAINRYKWFNLPNGIDGQLLERMLYYKGQLMFFNLGNEFYILPYALDGTIDVYGRFTGVTPLPFGGTTSSEKDKKAWVQGLTRKPIYDVLDEDLADNDVYENSCVLLHDYSKQLAEEIIPRQIINDPIIEAMAEAFPFARTSLIAHSGVKGMRVNDEDQAGQVKLASRAITESAMKGDIWIPLVASVELQELTDGSVQRSEEYLQYMQALDNFRLSLYGLKNGGIFEKDSAYVNSITADNIQNNVGLVYQDGLTIRQKFCDIVNSIWGLGIWCEASETVTATDMNGDGEIADNQDQGGIAGEQPLEVGNDNS